MFENDVRDVLKTMSSLEKSRMKYQNEKIVLNNRLVEATNSPWNNNPREIDGLIDAVNRKINDLIIEETNTINAICALINSIYDYKKDPQNSSSIKECDEVIAVLKKNVSRFIANSLLENISTDNFGSVENILNIDRYLKLSDAEKANMNVEIEKLFASRMLIVSTRLRQLNNLHQKKDDGTLAIANHNDFISMLSGLEYNNLERNKDKDTAIGKSCRLYDEIYQLAGEKLFGVILSYSDYLELGDKEKNQIYLFIKTNLSNPEIKNRLSAIRNHLKTTSWSTKNTNNIELFDDFGKFYDRYMKSSTIKSNPNPNPNPNPDEFDINKDNYKDIETLYNKMFELAGKKTGEFDNLNYELYKGLSDPNKKKQVDDAIKSLIDEKDPNFMNVLTELKDKYKISVTDIDGVNKIGEKIDKVKAELNVKYTDIKDINSLITKLREWNPGVWIGKQKSGIPGSEENIYSDVPIDKLKIEDDCIKNVSGKLTNEGHTKGEPFYLPVKMKKDMDPNSFEDYDTKKSDDKPKRSLLTTIRNIVSDEGSKKRKEAWRALPNDKKNLRLLSYLGFSVPTLTGSVLMVAAGTLLPVTIPILAASFIISAYNSTRLFMLNSPIFANPIINFGKKLSKLGEEPEEVEKDDSKDKTDKKESKPTLAERKIKLLEDTRDYYKKLKEENETTLDEKAILEKLREYLIEQKTKDPEIQDEFLEEVVNKVTRI